MTALQSIVPIVGIIGCTWYLADAVKNKRTGAAVGWALLLGVGATLQIVVLMALRST